MNDEKPPVYTRHPWGKSDRQDKARIHLLEHHLADVGACFEALLAQPTIRLRLARTAGLDSLDDVTAARLSVLAALHDIGKVNMGFQAQIWRQQDLKGKRRPHRASHYDDLKPILMNDDVATADWFSDALGWEEFCAWDDRGGETFGALLLATLSHHGRPLNLGNPLHKNPCIWRPFGGLSPEESVRRIGKLARQWFPTAFASRAPSLPPAPEFQHMFLGLCNLADWIGSKEDWFNFKDSPQDDYFQHAQRQAKTAVNAIGLDLSAQRSRFGGTPGFRDLFGLTESSGPNAIQRKAQEVSLNEPLVIIESETGSGKTEAALWRFAGMYEAGLVDGLYFALPTRAAAIQIHQRVEKFVANLFPTMHRPYVALAVPGYAASPPPGEAGLHDYNPHWEGAERRWATEHPKRFLAAQIAVGTVDQAMMGALQVKNAHMRTACLARNLLVVDEAHASDTYMSVVIEALLNAHVGAGGHALLMSATLGSVARLRWLRHGKRSASALPSMAMAEAIAAPYPAVSAPAGDGENLMAAGENNQEKRVRVEITPTMHDFAGTARRALEAARAGAKVLVVRNTVGHAISSQQALEDMAGPSDAALLFAVDGVTTLHHGRFAACDRKSLDGQVEALLGKDRDRQPGGRVLVGTQTLEQSLDIDADLLITDLCPVDVLLQRIGRLHRHVNNRPDGYADPVCIVLAPPGGDLSPMLKRRQDANGLGPYGGVYTNLMVLEATRRLIAGHPQWNIPEMNRMLVERATHPEVLHDIVKEMEEGWQKHANEVEGGGYAERQSALLNIIRRDKSFLLDNDKVVFPSDDKKIRTRLGDDRIDIAFNPAQSSPFGGSREIDGLAVSVRWLPAEKAPESVTPSPVEGGFRFSVGDRRFVYDRLGLRRL